MEKEICGYIYKITNIKNGKVYIGLTTNSFNERYNVKGEGIERVYGFHARLRKNGKPYNIHLLNSIEKYGFETFEVIKEFDIAYSIEELKEKEKYWISFYKCNDANYGYNRTEGGDSALSGEDSPLYKGFVVVYPNGEVSEEMSRNEVANYLNVGEDIIKDLAREKTCYIKRYEHIRYVRVLHLEDYLKEREIYKSNEEFEDMCKHMVEEAKILYEKKKEELSELNRNKPRLTGENHPNYGKPCLEETRKKISEANRGREVGEETRKKISESKIGHCGEKIKGIKNGSAKLLICIFPDGRIIKNCIKGLAEELEVSKDLVKDILHLKKPYEARKKHLKRLNGIVIMEEKDYLNTLKNTNTNINNDKAS